MFQSNLIKIFIWLSILGGISFFLIYETASVTLDQQIQLRQNRVDLEALKGSVDTINLSIREFQKLEQEKREAIQNNPNEITKLDIVNYALPENADPVDVYSIVGELATASGLSSVEVIPPQPSSTEGSESSVHGIQFTVTGDGTYEQVLGLVQRLEYHSRVFHINNIAVDIITDPEQTASGGEVSARISATAYYYSKNSVEQEV